MKGAVSTWVDSAAAAGSSRCDVGVGRHGALHVVDCGVLHGVVVAHGRVLQVVVDGGVLECVTVADGGGLEDRNWHEFQADAGGTLAVLSRAGTKVVHGGSLDGVSVSDGGVLEGRDALDAIVGSLDGAGGRLLAIKEQVVDGHHGGVVFHADGCVLQVVVHGVLGGFCAA